MKQYVDPQYVGYQQYVDHIIRRYLYGSRFNKNLQSMEDSSCQSVGVILKAPLATISTWHFSEVMIDSSPSTVTLTSCGNPRCKKVFHGGKNVSFMSQRIRSTFKRALVIVFLHIMTIKLSRFCSLILLMHRKWEWMVC